jgi:hypothetical protein
VLENWNSANKDIFYGKAGELTGDDKEQLPRTRTRRPRGRVRESAGSCRLAAGLDGVADACEVRACHVIHRPVSDGTGP